MDYIASLAGLAGVMTLSVISPGPNFVIVTSTAMRVSRRAGIAAALGLASASFTWATLTVAGLGLLLANLGWAYEAIRIAGAAYLIGIGIKMVLGARKPLDQSSPASPATSLVAMRKAFVVSMGNPKSIAFYSSIFAVMVPPHAPLWFYVATVGLATIISAGWYSGLALMFSKPAFRRVFAKAKTGAETVMGVCLVGLGGRLLVSR